MFSACFDSIGTKVNGVPLTTTLSEATKQHADVEELQSMPINTALEEADAIANDLDTFDKEAKKWTEDHDFRKSRCSLLALQARTNKNIKDLQQYLKCCKKLRTKARSSRRALKRKWRGNRDKLTAVFEAAGVPTGVAKVNADIPYSIVCDPKDFDLETDVQNPFLTFCGEEGVSAIDLLTPKMITAAGQREDDTWLNKSCSDWHSQNEAAARAKETINMTKMASENTASCICTASAGKPFQYEDPTGASNVLNCVTGLELPICTVKPYHLDTSLLAYPWRAHATFLTAFSGQAVILMYSAAALEEEPDIDKMVTTKKSKYFHNIYGFNVRKGESCWIPFGWTPMICPYEMSVMTAADEAPKEEGKTKKGKKKDEKNPKEEVFTYGLAPAYDETADARASVSLRRKVLNLWDAAEKMPASFNDNAKLQQWKKAITPEAKSLDDR